jgi:hypothetical protein
LLLIGIPGFQLYAGISSAGLKLALKAPAFRTSKLVK